MVDRVLRGTWLALATVVSVSACGAPPPPREPRPRADERVYGKVVPVEPLSAHALEEARSRPPPPRDTSEIGSVLRPEIQGGWQGEPTRELPPSPVPPPWHGLAVRYYLSEQAHEPWYFDVNGQRHLNDDRRKVISTYLVWNSQTGEGLILNPLASDIAFIVETARAQPGVRWLHVIDSHTGFKATPPLLGPEQVQWERGMAFRGGQVLHFRDADRTYRAKGEVFDAAGVATALGTTTLTRGLAEPELTKAGKLLVFRTGLDAPHWCFLEVEWGPFRFDGNWDGD